jgi:hypothetical protein
LSGTSQTPFKGEFGVVDVWTWTTTDAKLVALWMVSDRDGEAAKAVMGDLAARLESRAHLDH